MFNVKNGLFHFQNKKRFIVLEISFVFENVRFLDVFIRFRKIVVDKQPSACFVTKLFILME